MKKKPTFIFTVISTILLDTLLVFALAYYGPGRFFNTWWKANAIWVILIFVGATILLALWLNKISKNKDFAELKTMKQNIPQMGIQQVKYGIVVCPKCSKTDYYYYEGSPDAPCILECWSCRHRFSFVWCNKCGMGGDFVQGIQQEPDFCSCPKCKTVTPLSPTIYENPVTTFDFSDLPQSTRVQHLQAQYDYQVKSAIDSVILFAAIGIISLFLIPVVNVLIFFTNKPDIYSYYRTIPKIIPALLAIPGMFVYFLAMMGNILIPMRLIQALIAKKRTNKEGLIS